MKEEKEIDLEYNGHGDCLLCIDCYEDLNKQHKNALQKQREEIIRIWGNYLSGNIRKKEFVKEYQKLKEGK